jgi:hypothetical protein
MDVRATRATPIELPQHAQCQRPGPHRPGSIDALAGTANMIPPGPQSLSLQNAGL